MDYESTTVHRWQDIYVNFTFTAGSNTGIINSTTHIEPVKEVRHEKKGAFQRDV
jgi:hypothetical protein